MDNASSGVDTSGTPAANDFARFTDADTIEGRSYTEVKGDLNLEIGTDVQAWDAQLDTLAGFSAAQVTRGIVDDNLMTVDDADAADNDYAKFTTAGLEGRSYTEVKTDLSLSNVENTALSTWAGTTNVTTLGAVTATSAISQGTLTTSGNLNLAVDDSSLEVAGTPVVSLNGTTGLVMGDTYGMKHAVHDSTNDWAIDMTGPGMAEWQISDYSKLQVINTSALVGQGFTTFNTRLPSGIAGHEMIIVYLGGGANLNGTYYIYPFGAGLPGADTLYSGGSISSITLNETEYETVHLICTADTTWSVLSHT